MEEYSLSTWLAIAGVFGSAGLLRGFTGFGFALLAVPFGALWMTPEVLLPVVFLLQSYVGAFEVRSSIRSCHGPSLLWLAVGCIFGTPLGVYALIILPPAAIYTIIGTIVLVSTILLTLKPSADRLPLSIGAVAGVFSGIFSGMAAMPGPPAVFYFVRGGFSSAETRSSLILFFLMASLYAISVTVYVGLLHKDEFLLSLLILPIMALSTWLGTILFKRFGNRWYRLVGIICLAGAAVSAFAKAFSL